MSEDLKRFEVKLTHPSPSERDVITHTWASDRNGAIARIAQMMEAVTDAGDLVWSGWSFEVNLAPSEPAVSGHAPVWPNYIDNPR